MNYAKQTWIDGDATKPLSAARMTYMENGIEGAGISLILNTTGLTSAQIDTAVFGAVTPFDGVIISDSTNKLLLVRLASKWQKTVALTQIT